MCYTVAKAGDVNIQNFLDNASPITTAVIIEGDQRYVFLRQSFLNKFEADEKVEFLGFTLYCRWGALTVEVAKSRNTIKLVHSPEFPALIEWRVRWTGSSLDFISGQLAKAERFQRQPLTFKVYEV